MKNFQKTLKIHENYQILQKVYIKNVNKILNKKIIENRFPTNG